MEPPVAQLWRSKLASPEEIAAQVRSGWSCCSDIALGLPYGLLEQVGRRVEEGQLRGVTLHTLLDVGELPCYTGKLAGRMTGVSWFSGAGARRAAAEGYGDVMPCYYRDMPALFTEFVDVDAFFCAAAPMDADGFFSAGINGSNTQAMRRKAKRIYLEVNDRMPRASHGPAIHISEVTAFCQCSTPLPTAEPVVPDPVSTHIGALIAREVPDGATIQLGIGAIPDAVGLALKSKRELGIHTELFTDSMVQLIQCGAVTNSRKPIHTGRSVATLVYGSQRMYDFVDGNPALELLPVDHVNDPAVIAAHPNFISVNSALEVDFFGQVCAESLGTRHISGTGGQADYVRGAVQSPGGKSFIAFSSTAAGGKISRIRPTLTPGAVVTTSKNDVDYIVTEQGAARLRGKTLSQRTRALIGIAHPSFRDRLTFEAKKLGVLI